MTETPRTLLSTDALPIASVILPRELTPKGAPLPADRDPPVRSAARTRRRLAVIAVAIVVSVPLAWFAVVRHLPRDWHEVGVIAALSLIGLGIVAAIAYDHDRFFEARRRRGWQRALAQMGGAPRALDGGRVAMQVCVRRRAYLVEIGTDDVGLQFARVVAVPEPGEALAPLVIGRRSTARRFWPTGDVDFDARVAVYGPFTLRVALLDEVGRAVWTEAVGLYDVSVDDGRLFFSLAYAPRTSRPRAIRRLVAQLCVAAGRLVYRPEAVPDRLARLIRDPGPPAVAANALRALRSMAPGTRAVADAEALLLGDPDPWRRLLAAEVAGHEDALIGLLAEADPAVRSRAVEALVELWPVEGLADRLDVLLDHPSPALRGAVLSTLGARSLPLADLRLAAAVADPHPAVGAGALDWLATATGPLADAALIRLLAHPAPAVVHRAADRLGRVGAPGVEHALADLARQRPHRAAARSALGLLRQRYPESLGGEVIARRR
ncbi:MAG: hypothetical protein H6701_15345 [Myxococcales bacterium]|nr:hypothetical protein [Myxococcales bacterium]